jgi:hypothetical protein
MRLPVSKIYRGFPELDPFTDTECEMYVARARSRRMGSGCLMAIVAAAAGIGCAVALAFLTSQLFVPLAGALGLRIGPDHEMETGILVLGAHIVIAFIVGLLVRDAWLRSSIKQCLKSARCPKCDYSLLGLPIVSGIVKCPECGSTRNLVAAGLVAEDLLSKELPLAPPTM